MPIPNLALPPRECQTPPAAAALRGPVAANPVAGVAPTRHHRRVTTYRWGHIDHDSAPAWLVLANALATADDTGEHYDHVEDLVEELEEPGVDPVRDTIAVWDGERMVGFLQLRVATAPDQEGRVRCFLMGGVLPSHRRQGIGRRLMDLGEARATELAEDRHPGRERFARAEGGQEGDDVRRMLEARGYEPVRWFHEMRRRTDGDPVDVPDVDATLLSPTGRHEEPTRITHNLAFRDHWGSSENSPEAWHQHWTARSARPEVSTVVVDPTDEERVLAYVLVSQWVDREAYITQVGTAPDARGRGLALAALARTVRLCTESEEYDVIDLHVDSDSPTGATRLYERAGFTVRRRTASYMRDLP